MTLVGWAQILVYGGLIVALPKPLGAYMFRVFEGEAQPRPRVLGTTERFVLRLCGIRVPKEQTRREYAGALLAFSLFGVLVTYAIQRLQHVLALNPQASLPSAPTSRSTPR